MKTFFKLPIIISILVFVLMTGCSKETEQNIPTHDISEIEKLSNVDAQKAFAEILSKAVSNSEDVRNFIKNEALAQFDNDYDVFYPFVKDKEVTDGKTFRDILMSYCDNKEDLTQIEDSSLLLNILVPDLTLFWDFNAETWDTGDNAVAVISRDDDENTLYEDGEVLGNLSLDEIPAFPCLVVKNNERLKVSNKATRAADAAYEFISDVYDRSKTGPETRSYTQNIDLTDPNDPSLWEFAYAKASELDPAVITGWNEFGTDITKAQRDYSYYGMTRSNSQGVLKPNYSEEVLMFKFNGAFSKISDQFGDPGFEPQISPGKGKGGYTNEQILKKVWTEGNFEFNFKSFIAMEGSNTAIPGPDMNFTVPPDMAFTLDKTLLSFTNATAFRRSHYIYHSNVNDIKSRWIRPKNLPNRPTNTQVFAQPWNLSNKSLDVYVYVYEYDASGKHTMANTTSFTFVNTDNYSGDGYSSGQQNTIIQSVVITHETTEGPDEISKLQMYYTDPVIREDTEKNLKGYRVYSVSNGYIEAVFAPRARY